MHACVRACVCVCGTFDKTDIGYLHVCMEVYNLIGEIVSPVAVGVSSGGPRVTDGD